MCSCTCDPELPDLGYFRSRWNTATQQYDNVGFSTSYAGTKLIEFLRDVYGLEPTIDTEG